MSDFQERLWSELVREHAAALAYPAAAPNRLSALPILEARSPLTLRWAGTGRGRLAASVAALVIVLVVATITATTSTTPSAAYAVTQNADGSVTVTVGELIGVDGANSELARLGIRARVIPVVAGCTAAGEPMTPPPPLRATLAHVEGQGVALRPNLIPAGETLVLAARQVGSAVYLTYSLYSGPVPSCVAAG